MEILWQDLKYALRMMGKNPGFAATAALTLALGIGANTAIFTVINALLLRRLPVPAPQELVVLSDPASHGMKIGSETGDRDLFSYQEFEYFRDHNQALSEMFGVASRVSEPDVHVEGSAPGSTQGSAAETCKVSQVTGGYFPVLRVPAMLGRTFNEEVDRARDANPVAVISYNFWKRRFALEPAILGRTLRVNQTAFTLIGVMPPGFFGETVGESPDFWVPLSMQAAVYPGRDFLSPRKSVREKVLWLQLIGRRKPGLTFAQANASLNVTFQQMLQGEAGSAPAEKDRREILDQKIKLQDGSRGASNLRERYSQPLLVLMGLVGMVLLIACGNVANLLLARAAARRKEIAVRLALGASRPRLLRQLLTESVLLAAIGGALGLLLASWTDGLLVRMVSEEAQAIPLDVRLDASTLGFTLGICLLTAILFGLIPALRATRLDLTSALKPASRGGTGGVTAGGRIPVGKVLVISQVALSLSLLIVAGLFVRSLQKLSEVKLGYTRENMLLFHLDPVPAGYKDEAARQLLQQLQEKFAGLPGVRGATLSDNGLFVSRESGDPIWVEGYTPKSDAEMNVYMDQVGPNYFTTVGIPILMGREIGPQDTAGAPRVAVINQTMAQKFFRDRSPIGKRVRDVYPDNPGEMEIVGVVADAKYHELREKTPARLYAPFFHPLFAEGAATFEIRTGENSAATAATIREAVKAADPGLPALKIRTMQELVDRSLVKDRMITRLSSLFGLVALLLASIGLYGVMAYTVARRTNEIGIRMALGAGRGNVLRMVLGETLTLVLIGVAAGLPIIFATSRLLSSLLFSLTGTDPFTLGTATAVMIVVAAAAGYFPARRASRLMPMAALRYE